MWALWGGNSRKVHMQLILLGLTLLFACELPASDLEAVKRDARRWVTELGKKPLGVACSNVDGDGDGYVSCTVALDDGQILPLECRAWLGSGCKMRPEVVVKRR